MIKIKENPQQSAPSRATAAHLDADKVDASAEAVKVRGIQASSFS